MASVISSSSSSCSSTNIQSGPIIIARQQSSSKFSPRPFLLSSSSGSSFSGLKIRHHKTCISVNSFNRFSRKVATSNIVCEASSDTTLDGSSFAGNLTNNHQITRVKSRRVTTQYMSLRIRMKVSQDIGYEDELTLVKRRDVLGLTLSVSSLLIHSLNVEAAGLPPQEVPRLCDDSCEKELENVPMITTESGLQYKDIKVGSGPTPPVGYQVAANYVAMVPSGQVFDSSLEKRQVYIFRVGSGQVVKGLDEGILSMKVGGKRRLYVPGSLAFPKGLTSAPGRPRVAPNSPVIFDVSLEYIPGLDDEEE